MWGLAGIMESCPSGDEQKDVHGMTGLLPGGAGGT